MSRYYWARRGDINAFFGLMLDNVAVMIILFSAVTSTLPVEEQAKEGLVRFTPGFVLTRMIPGTAIGVLIGDLVYTAMAFRLARAKGRDDVTAMPLGLDTPSTFGVAFLVLLPALQKGYADYRDHERAMEFAWHVGLAVLVMAGLFKVLCAPMGNAVRRLVPRAGLLGSLAAIALALIAFLPLLLDGIAAVPMVGMVALTVILITLVAHRELPGKFPGALAAVLIGVIIYQVGLALGKATGVPVVPPPRSWEKGTWEPTALVSFYRHNWEWWSEVLKFALGRLPVVLPFALATIVGGIDCTESAAAAGDEYDTRSILLTEGVASVAAGLLGGVIQTTPYIGHPAYKKMGGRAAYTLATALFVGAVGYFGGFTLLFEWLPTAAMFPILVFVGLEITAQSFHATPVKHYPAVALAILPALAYLSTVIIKNVFGPLAPEGIEGALVLQTLRCLANGFLVSGLLWAAALAMILDGRLVRAAGYFAIAGACALVGIIHSPLPDERIDLPGRVLAPFVQKERDLAVASATAVSMTGGPALPVAALAPWAVVSSKQRDVPAVAALRYQTPYHWAAAYGLVALVLLGLARFRERPEEEKGLPGTR
jgi:AGZA family xanthine/uracil permease-like MFS transporter